MSQQPNNIITPNERSWAIELITQINEIASSYDLVIKRAGGENTISSEKRKMFPDVLLFGNEERTKILQGWEVKMPDVPITDEEFVRNAQMKARVLRLKSCVIWNFTYAKFYVLNEQQDYFEEINQWDNLNIKTRKDVKTYHTTWENTLKDVILYANEYFITNKVRQASMGDVISQYAIDIIINENKKAVADNYKENSVKNTVLGASIDAWWEKIKEEYLHDESDKFTAYAKTIILNWSYRIIFAHIIKRERKEAFLVDNIDVTTTPEEADNIFSEITSRCDFFNIFASMEWNTLLPQQTWDSLIELSLFLKENGIQSIDQAMLQNVLEKSVNTTRRELNGQYTTPQILARILVSITVRDWSEDCCDPCCGTGTIAYELLRKKKDLLNSVQKSLDSLWASDKYTLPLQIANISMASSDSINYPIRLFSSNALDLYNGKEIKITDPRDGKKITLAIPLFGAICSNLPFIESKKIPKDDKILINKHLDTSALSGKFDLYQYIALYLSEMLCDGGWLGIITSNAWLGTTSGTLFYEALNERYDLKQVHISGAGRWMKNVKVVTTILILQKKQKLNEPKTNFYVWHKSLEEIESNSTIERCIINSSLWDKEVQDSSIISKSTYSCSEIEELRQLNLSYNTLFHNVKWALEIQDKLKPLKSIFKVIRGCRRGCDELFLPKDGHNIERVFMKPILINARNINRLIATPNGEAFCCSKDLEELENNYPNAFLWIKKFENQKNKTGKNLADVLKRPKMKWYEMKPNEIAQFFTMMNPDNRLFIGRFPEPSFINQRCIGLNLIDETTDTELCHALLNSILTKFFIEAVGFGRGMGALDMNKNNFSQCYMLNPNLISNIDAQKIKEYFKIISTKNIMHIEREMLDNEWITFNKIILKAYGIENYYEKICASLSSLRKVRHTVKDKKSKK